MDGWGGRRATWCHKAQLASPVRGVSSLPEPRLGVGPPSVSRSRSSKAWRRPCTEARQDQASGA